MADTRKSWGGIFGLLGMDSENTGEFKHVCSRKEGPLRFLLSLFWSPLGKKANDQSLFSLKKNLMLPTGGPYPRHYFLKHKKKKKIVLLEKIDFTYHGLDVGFFVLFFM